MTTRPDHAQQMESKFWTVQFCESKFQIQDFTITRDIWNHQDTCWLRGGARTRMTMRKSHWQHPNWRRPSFKANYASLNLGRLDVANYDFGWIEQCDHIVMVPDNIDQIGKVNFDSMGLERLVVDLTVSDSALALFSLNVPHIVARINHPRQPGSVTSFGRDGINGKYRYEERQDYSIKMGKSFDTVFDLQDFLMETVCSQML